METSQIVELRQYTLHPGGLGTLLPLFEREFVTGQEAAGIRVGGRFRDLDAPDRFVWMRAFPDMAARTRALQAFYGGPVWRAHRAEANATMADSDNVLLLRGPGYRVPDDAGLVVATICHPADPAGFTAPPSARAVHRTEHAENGFPALPVRTGEDVVVWFSAHADADAHRAAPSAPLPAGALRRPFQELRLVPVRGPLG
ncbi:MULTISPECIES: NIPSNAP family protein [unclassified Streptomyces]|uniref:NIPSNAP family protein n=1 Tax=unclassified Streptomyces TaxID=2593676 RepID=UPI00380B22BE